MAKGIRLPIGRPADPLDPVAAIGGPKVGSFVRGVTLGALVGAAIAGTALLQRRRPLTRAQDAANPVPPGP